MFPCTLPATESNIRVDRMRKRELNVKALECVPHETVIMSCQSFCCRRRVLRKKNTERERERNLHTTIEYLLWRQGSGNKTRKVVAFTLCG